MKSSDGNGDSCCSLRLVDVMKFLDVSSESVVKFQVLGLLG